MKNLEEKRKDSGAMYRWMNPVSWAAFGVLALTLSGWTSTAMGQTLQVAASFDIVSPQAIDTGDLNGDTHLDFVIASPLTSAVVVLQGDGQGGFAAPRYFDCPFPFHLALDDINDDGALDLITANFLDSSLGILLGDGAGNFGSLTLIDTGGAPHAVDTGDFNGDGLRDLVFADHGQGHVSWFPGDGAGGFGAPQLVTNQASASHVLVADLDRDGVDDLAITTSQSSSFGLFYGDGLGGFPLAVPYDLGIDDSLWDIAARDLNGDETLDLVIPCPNADAVAVFVSSSNFTYSPPHFPTVGNWPQATRVEDLDNDGEFDLITANVDGGTVSVNRGIGGGAFESPTNFPCGVESVSVVYGDFREDGLIDVVVANLNSGSVVLLVNDGDSRPTLQRGDLDGDGVVFLGDAVSLLSYLFGPESQLQCPDAGDVDDNGAIELSDVIQLLSGLFGGPSAFLGMCEADETGDGLDECVFSVSCP